MFQRQQISHNTFFFNARIHHLSISLFRKKTIFSRHFTDRFDNATKLVNRVEADMLHLTKKWSYKEGCTLLHLCYFVAWDVSLKTSTWKSSLDHEEANICGARQRIKKYTYASLMPYGILRALDCLVCLSHSH